MVSIGYNAVSTTTPAVPPAITPSAKNLKNTHTHILYEKKGKKRRYDSAQLKKHTE
jgi:hypothetical protein